VIWGGREVPIEAKYLLVTQKRKLWKKMSRFACLSLVLSVPRWMGKRAWISKHLAPRGAQEVNDVKRGEILLF